MEVMGAFVLFLDRITGRISRAEKNKTEKSPAFRLSVGP